MDRHFVVFVHGVGDGAKGWSRITHCFSHIARVALHASVVFASAVLRAIHR